MRPEYKLAVYTRYVLPSLRYHLTVHTVHKTHLDELDLLAQSFLKRWLTIPARGATSAGIFSPRLLGIKPVSQVYLEGHVGAFVNSTLVADPDTKQALRNALEREGGWSLFEKDFETLPANNVAVTILLKSSPSPYLLFLGSRDTDRVVRWLAS